MALKVVFVVACMTALFPGLLADVCNQLGLTPQCDSEIYCYGDLLHTVQMARIFPDSKTFVDMKLKSPPADTLAKFRLWQTDFPDPTSDDVAAFVQDNFDDVGSEFEPWTPTDHKPASELGLMDNIADNDYKDWFSYLHDLWLELGRKIADDVKNNKELYSMIPVSNPIIVPGGRFREYYYWDSYWVIKGLLLSEMYDTVKGMLENFLEVVDTFGFVTNGGRIYYTGRSQPPLLIPMVKDYFDATGDREFLQKALPLLEKEFNYWMTKHVVYVRGFPMYVYKENSCGPRPESYYEDFLTASQCSSDIDRENLYSEIKAAACSGMDFSSRWFVNKGTNNGTLVDLKTRSIVPVDLNSWLFYNAKILASFYKTEKNIVKNIIYDLKAANILVAIEQVLWDEKEGIWLDYDLINKKRRNYYVASNFAPLYTGAYNLKKREFIAKAVLDYITKHGLDDFISCPNTLVESGQQWDFPNVWPPMLHLIVTGLDKLNTPASQQLAEAWASRYVKSNFVGFHASTQRCMYEKYSAQKMGYYGGGGEYDIQIGFGWSNGVIICLLNKYGKTLTSTDPCICKYNPE